ncbi:alpha-L-fucosidase [Eisenbergiella sp.]
MRLKTDGSFEICKGKFSGTLESLGAYECPEWFQEAKLGIWSHWGPQSVPMYGDWYARKMYLEGSDEYRFHCRKYGHPSQFGYKDVINLWKAERFEPEKLMKLYKEAGAGYFVAQAMHHDNFDNFNSVFQPRFNSVKMGPCRDIVGEWKSAAEKNGLKFGLSEHLAGSPGFLHAAKGCDRTGKYKGIPYDGNLEEFYDLYYDETNVDMAWEKNWFCTKEEFYRHWFLRMKDAVDKYAPDLVYTDGPIPCGKYGLELVAHLYNSNMERNGGKNLAVYTQKNTELPMRNAAVLDIECAREENVTSYYWQTDTSFGDWSYNLRDTYKTWNEVIEMLIDIVSKNGNLLINVPQRPDGTIDEECEWMLTKMAEWMKINKEGIYGTHPFRVSGEGTSEYRRHSRYDQNAVSWQAGDVRYTCRDNYIYAYLMRWPGKLAILSSIPYGKEVIKKAELLGYGEVSYYQTGAGMLAELPDCPPSEFVSCLKLTV